MGRFAPLRGDDHKAIAVGRVEQWGRARAATPGPRRRQEQQWLMGPASRSNAAGGAKLLDHSPVEGVPIAHRAAFALVAARVPVLQCTAMIVGQGDFHDAFGESSVTGAYREDIGPSARVFFG